MTNWIKLGAAVEKAIEEASKAYEDRANERFRQDMKLENPEPVLIQEASTKSIRH